MKKVLNKIKGVGLISICVILFTPLNSSAKTPEQVFDWVVNLLGVTESYPMPAISFLDKSALQSVFKESNKHSKLQWNREFGEKKANQMMQMYLEELLGLFDPKTKNIYIGNFIEPCRKQAVLAHEMMHYFQTVLNKSYVAYYGGPEEQKFLREMEAYGIEKRYRRLFCENREEESG